MERDDIFHHNFAAVHRCVSEVCLPVFCHLRVRETSNTLHTRLTVLRASEACIVALSCTLDVLAPSQKGVQLGGSPVDRLLEICQLVERCLQFLRPFSFELSERLLLCSSCVLPRALSASY